MMDKFTSNFQAILSQAQSIAVGNEHQFIEPSHIMQALLVENSQLLILAGVDTNKLKQACIEKTNSLPTVSGGDVQLSENTRRILNVMD